MTNIATHFRGLDLVDDWSKICDLIIKEENNAQASVTFLGSRVVTAEGYTGSIRLDEVWDKIIYPLADVPNQMKDTAERVKGIDLLIKMEDFVHKTDDQMDRSWFFTRIFNWIREYFNPSINYHYYMDSSRDKWFRYYPSDKCSNEFEGVNFGYNPIEGYTDDIFSWTIVKEAAMRKLVEMNAGNSQ